MHTMTTPEPKTESGSVTPPVLPKGGEAEAAKESLLALRRFHLGAAEPATGTGGDWFPALLHPYRGGSGLGTGFPYAVTPDGADPGKPLADLLAAAAPAEKLLTDNLLRLTARVAEGLSQAVAPAPARAAVEEGGSRMLRELKLSRETEPLLAEALAALVKAIPASTVLVPWTERAPLDLLYLAASGATARRRAAFRKDLAATVERTRALLETDRMKRPEGRSGDAVQRGVGEVGSKFFDPSALAGMVGTGTRAPIPEERRERLGAALARLEGGLAEEPPYVLVHDGSFARLVEPLAGWRIETGDDPVAAAAARFDEAAASLAELLRAERLARLEYAGEYVPERHDPWLARFDWKGMNADELHLLPPVVALVTAEHLARRGMLSLSRLLLSGRPVLVVVLDQPASNPGSEGNRLDGFRFEPGYLGLGHREAFVAQSTAARPVHLMKGYLRSLAGTRSALHVTAAAFDPQGKEPKAGAWLQAGAALEGRAHPMFVYDPEAGASWARRLDFGDNPSPGDDWPAEDLSVKQEGGGETVLHLAFTFADFALLEPDYDRHFLAVPEGAGEKDVTLLSAWLDMPAEKAEALVPFVWGVDGRGRLGRLAVTRGMALAARDRLMYWRTLQELAGLRSEYVEEAARRAREDAEARAREAAEVLVKEHAAELDRIRGSAWDEAVTRLTAALLEVDPAALAGTASPLEPFRGRSVDEVARTLLEAARPETLDAAAPAPAGERIEQAASELMKLIDPGRLEENAS